MKKLKQTSIISMDVEERGIEDRDEKTRVMKKNSAKEKEKRKSIKRKRKKGKASKFQKLSEFSGSGRQFKESFVNEDNVKVSYTHILYF